MRPLLKWLIGVFIVLALIGFFDATYLTAEDLRGTIPPCSVVKGCSTVLTSRYSEVMGVPVAAFGVLYYGILLALLLGYIDSGSRRILRLAFGLLLPAWLLQLISSYFKSLFCTPTACIV